MTIAYGCVAVAAFLPFVFTVISKAGDKSFDNNKPRDWVNRQDGYRKRANWAQLNAFEAFPMFAAAVIIAALCHVDQARLDLLAVAFIVARLLYGVLYLADKASLRSVAWFAGVLCVAALFVLSAMAG